MIRLDLLRQSDIKYTKFFRLEIYQFKYVKHYLNNIRQEAE